MKQKKKEKIQMTMDRETAAIISRACEFYSRVLCGQFEEIPREVCDCQITKVFEEEGEEKMHERFNDLITCRNDSESLFTQARHVQFPELSPCAHYGFGYSRLTDRAFDVYQVLRHTIAWHDHPEGGITVNFNKPLTNYDLPTAEFIKE